MHAGRKVETESLKVRQVAETAGKLVIDMAALVRGHLGGDAESCQPAELGNVFKVMLR